MRGLWLARGPGMQPSFAGGPAKSAENAHARASGRGRRGTEDIMARRRQIPGPAPGRIPQPDIRSPADARGQSAAASGAT
jgi:hypothetical protein